MSDGTTLSQITAPPAAAPPAMSQREQTAGAYVTPRLEPLGAWHALTLQQSVPIGPGSFLPDVGPAERLG